jgi:hypothetical protein
MLCGIEISDRLLAEPQMKLSKCWRLFGAFPQESASFDLQRCKKIVNSAVDVAAILPAMTSDVFGMSATDANVQAVPRTVVTLGATGTTRMRIQVSRLFVRCHPDSPQARCGGMERVPSRLQVTRSPFGAVSIISGATAKEIRVSRVNRARVLFSNSIINAVNSLSSMKRT